jgi:hypothetical protein
MGENLPANDEENFEIPDASPEGPKKLLDLAAGYLNMSRSNHASPSETHKDVQIRMEKYLEYFNITIYSLETMYPGGNWEQRAREETDKKFA